MFCNLSPPRIFLSLDLLSEYRIQHGAIGPLYVTSSYSTWIVCRGVPGFAIDCPCGVWCRGLTTCLLHVGPSFGNRLLNNSWPVFFSSTPVLKFSIDVVLILSIRSYNIGGNFKKMSPFKCYYVVTYRGNNESKTFVIIGLCITMASSWPKPLPGPMLTYCPREQTSMNWNQHTRILIEDNSFQNVVCPRTIDVSSWISVLIQLV